MSAFTISSLKYIEPTTLKTWLTRSSSATASTTPAKFLIVDVRDSDHAGGNIAGSLHVPYAKVQFECPNIFNKLKELNAEAVVFHCALSQQRGPSSAMKFLRFLGDNYGNGNANGPSEDAEFASRLQVYILKDGFNKWQELYGKDENLTADYDESIWKFGF